MNTKNTHWTNESIADFQYSIAADFALQIRKKMSSAPSPVNNKEMAIRLGVTPGRVTQVLNDPSNLELKTIIKYSRAIGMKVAVVAYDDNDQGNKRGPINSEVFQVCWERQGRPINFLELDHGAPEVETVKVPSHLDYVPGEGRSMNRTTDRPLLVSIGPWQQELLTR